MAINDLVRDAGSTQYFPETSMPDSTLETIHAFTEQDDAYMDDEHDQREMDDNIIGALKDCLEEIDIKVKELFKKILSNEYVGMSIGRLAREAIGEAGAKDFLGKIVTKVINKMKAEGDKDMVVSKRGIIIDDELSQKLERFKVKTMYIGGVINEDNKRP